MDEHVIEVTGMRLANRAYLYRMFHIAFGAEPSAEELRALGSAESVAAMRYLGQACREDDAAAAEELAKTADALAALGAKADDEDFVASLKSDFTRLFLAPGDAYVHPWESPYIGKETMLFQESTLDVRHRFREHGFTAAEFGHFPEDHVSMMLDFLAHLSSRAYDAFGDGRDAEAVRVLLSQEDFVNAHLLNWLPDFRSKLHAADQVGTFALLSDSLQAFLQVDARFAGRLASWLEAGDRP